MKILESSKDCSNSNYAIYLAVVVIQLFVVALTFGLLKKEFHGDEIWSFGIANSSKGFTINSLDDRDSDKNYGKWISGNVLHDYITIQKNERFDLSMPYKNSEKDAHPPLSYMLITLTSSLFPEKFSYWFYFIFNLAAFLIIDLCFVSICERLKFNYSLPLAAIILFGFSVGGINTVTFLRMYALFAAFLMSLICMCVKIYCSKEIRIVDLCAITGIMCLGALTNHQFLIFAFFVTIFMLGYFAVIRQWKLFLKFGFSALIGAALSIIIFPATIEHFLYNGTEDGGFLSQNDYPYGIKIRWVLQEISHSIWGFGPTVFSNGIIRIASGVIIYSVIILIPLYLLTRKTNTVMSVRAAIKRWGVNTWKNTKKNAFILLFLLYIILVFTVVEAWIAPIMHMGPPAVRYILPVLPAFALFTALLIDIMISSHMENRKIGIVVTMILTATLVAFTYTFSGPVLLGLKSRDGTDIRSVKHSDIILVEGSTIELNRLPGIINPDNRIFPVTFEDVKTGKYIDRIADRDKSRNLYIIASGADKDKRKLSNTVSSYAAVFDESDSSKAEREYDKYVKKWLSKLTDSLDIDIKDIGRENTLNSEFVLYQCTHK